MAIIWQSSWFWMMICTVLLLLVGCTVFKGIFASSEDVSFQPTATISGTFPTFPPPDLVFTPISEIDIGIRSTQGYSRSTLLPPIPIDDITIDVPSCFYAPAGDYSCIGRIHNHTADKIGNVSFYLEFLNDLGDIISRQEGIIAQQAIETGHSASYRAFVDREISDRFLQNIRIEPSIARTFPPMANVANLDIADARGEITDSGRYSLSVTIVNNSGYVAEDIRVFTTLDSIEWGIVGYNIHEVENGLNDGARQLVQLEVIPHALPRQITHHLHVEAIINR